MKLDDTMEKRADNTKNWMDGGNWRVRLNITVVGFGESLFVFSKNVLFDETNVFDDGKRNVCGIRCATLLP